MTASSTSPANSARTHATRKPSRTAGTTQQTGFTTPTTSSSRKSRISAGTSDSVNASSSSSAFSAVWTLLGFAVALSGTSVAQTLLVIFVPAAAAYDLGRERWRVQRTVATERRRAAGVAAAALTTATSGPLTPERRSELTPALAHQVQDTLYRTRAEFGRVPGILYNSRREQDEAEFANMAETHRTNLTAGTA